MIIQNETAVLKLTSAVGIAGVLCRKGEIVTVPEAAAKNLLHRGKAVLATEADRLAHEQADDGGQDDDEQPEDGDGDESTATDQAADDAAPKPKRGKKQ